MKTSDGEMRGGSPRGDQADLQHTQESTGDLLASLKDLQITLLADHGVNGGLTEESRRRAYALVVSITRGAAAASDMLAALKELDVQINAWRTHGNPDLGRILKAHEAAADAIAAAESAAIKPRT